MATPTGFYVQKMKLLHPVGLSEYGFADLLKEINGINGWYYMGMARTGEDMTRMKLSTGGKLSFKVRLENWVTFTCSHSA